MNRATTRTGPTPARRILLALLLGLGGAGFSPRAQQEDPFPLRPPGELDSGPAAVAAQVGRLASAEAAVAADAEARLFWIGEPARARLEEGARSAHAATGRSCRRLLGLLDRAARLEPLHQPEMRAGYCRARTDVADAGALGGFYESPNTSRPVPEGLAVAPDALQLVARTGELLAFEEKYRGFALYLVNATREKAGFVAQDSRLDVVMEAVDPDGRWRPLEWLPHSWCGNSYHGVSLSPGRAFRFAVPEYAGPLETRARFRMDRGRDGEPLYSNEFSVRVDPRQFHAKGPISPRPDSR